MSSSESSEESSVSGDKVRDESFPSSDESDYLDNSESRKRRRKSPDGGDDEIDENDISDSDDDEELKAAVAMIKAPSRIKKTSTQAAADNDTPGVHRAHNPILTATDASATFADLQVRPWLVQSLSNMAIRRPTAIQKGCIPEILKGRDCIGGSRTGSGKTVAFAAPILQKWAEDPSAIYAVVLTATRELALQIFEQFKAISAPQSLKAILVTGGADMRAQAIELGRRPHVVIATPGRLADHIRTSGEDTICGLKRVRFLVLDEADRLLHASGPGSMLPDVEECLTALPPATERQTLLFTATVTPEVRALKEMPPKPGKQPAYVCEVDTQTLAVPTTLSQMYVQIPITHKEHYLHVFLLTEANADKTVILFCNRTSRAEYLHHLLRLLDHRVTSLHSKLPQRQRIDNLGRFRASAARILVATDVAARGLDIPEVSLVINYDLPRDPDDYIHRVGRTARAGRKGESVTFVGQRDVDLVHAIEKRVGREMEAWSEEGVNLETRVVRDALKTVTEKKHEALLNIEEGREVGGRRKRTKQALRAE